MNLNKTEILQDYVNYCIDTKKDTKSKNVKKTYIKNLLLYMYDFNNLKIADFEKTKKEIENIFKYNTLTIEHLKEKQQKELNTL